MVLGKLKWNHLVTTFIDLVVLYETWATVDTVSSQLTSIILLSQVLSGERYKERNTCKKNKKFAANI